MSTLWRATLRSLYHEQYQHLLRLGWPPFSARRIVACDFRRTYCH